MSELLYGGRDDSGNEEKTQNMLLLQNCHQKDSQNVNDTVLAPKG